MAFATGPMYTPPEVVGPEPPPHAARDREKAVSAAPLMRVGFKIESRLNVGEQRHDVQNNERAVFTARAAFSFHCLTPAFVYGDAPRNLKGD
ncbi:hypothetical protein [Caballeronia sp. LZ035]|uniref:hypothetical protein n=1 Tax=Caballeronia sp. LZ035 TaxID=3038568 RepID=UPI00285E60C1|nr:hypothetical protein [Caballeronia sp. LZ035]MDR5758800.1 hypothetical protein [Caballeronia sp. LZ035]